MRGPQHMAFRAVCLALSAPPFDKGAAASGFPTGPASAKAHAG